MLVFINKASSNAFFVDHLNSKLLFLTVSDHRTFRKFANFLRIEYITLPDLKTVHRFRKIVESGALVNVAEPDFKQFILSNYPEYFI